MCLISVDEDEKVSHQRVPTCEGIVSAELQYIGKSTHKGLDALGRFTYELHFTISLAEGEKTIREEHRTQEASAYRLIRTLELLQDSRQVGLCDVRDTRTVCKQREVAHSTSVYIETPCSCIHLVVAKTNYGDAAIGHLSCATARQCT